MSRSQRSEVRLIHLQITSAVPASFTRRRLSVEPSSLPVSNFKGVSVLHSFHAHLLNLPVQAVTASETLRVMLPGHGGREE